MKKLILICILVCNALHADDVVLESKILSTVDGYFINADIIGMIRAYQIEIRKILLIKCHRFLGEEKSVHELSEIQKTTKRTPANDPLSEEFDQALLNAKQQFVSISNKFKSVVRNTKDVMEILIKESCKKRNRMDSLLLVWANTKEENEDALFDEHVRTIDQFETFCIHLYDFLGDFTKSCPKGMAQYETRMKKLTKIKEALSEISSISEKEKADFIKYIRPQVDKLKEPQLTRTKIQELFTQFKK